jgi:hypothetical protein
MKIENTIVNGIPLQTIIYEKRDMATNQQKDEWLDICNTCEYKNDTRCKYCGCIIDTLMMLKTSKCPIEKW